ncbi:MAG TPA: aminoglycoside phosphotransferase family protein [Chloroflexota bacterium]|nr:aminoglycoside phosphotransferase family protein [Chloroflexota bacterium]
MSYEVNQRDPVLAADLVLRLARRHLPSATKVSGVDETGGEARAYAIDADWILKTQRPHRVRPRTSLAKEAFHLGQLAENAPEVNVPRVLGYGRQGDVEYILMTRMPGVALRYVAVEGDARMGLLRDLGAALRRMHGLSLDPFVNSQLFPGDADSAAIADRLARDLDRAVEAATAQRDEWTLPVSPADFAQIVREGVRSVTDPPVALHSNPGPEHVFVDPTTLRLSGIIDFGDAYLSHPAMDMRRWGAPADRSALIAGYAADGPPSDTFHANWRAISVANLMLDFASRPSRRIEALRSLQLLMAT